MAKKPTPRPVAPNTAELTILTFEEFRAIIDFINSHQPSAAEAIALRLVTNKILPYVEPPEQREEERPEEDDATTG